MLSAPPCDATPDLLHIVLYASYTSYISHPPYSPISFPSVFDAPIVDSPRYLARLADELQRSGVELFLGQQRAVLVAVEQRDALSHLRNGGGVEAPAPLAHERLYQRQGAVKLGGFIPAQDKEQGVWAAVSYLHKARSR